MGDLDLTNLIVKNSQIINIKYGEGVTIIQPVNLYGCDLGDFVFIGPFVEIQQEVVVGSRTRIQSHSFICGLVTIGADCFIGHGVVFINDLFADGHPARGDRGKYKSTIIQDRVSIGSNATICPVTICSDAVIGAGSVVTRDIKVPGTYAGNPAKLIREFK